LGEVAGIAIKIHVTFLLLLAWVAFAQLAQGQDVRAAAEGVGFTLALFGIVVLHELGHALTALRFGIKTRDITLLPIGGVSRLERIPENPWQELLVAFAGPAVNVVLAAGLYAVLRSGDVPVSPAGADASVGILVKLFWANVALAVFNLLPAFPMDGGRVLRALLATSLDYTRATQVAATVGQIMALIFGFVGLLANPVLIFIALFVWIGAAQESSLVNMREALSGVPVGQAMVRRIRSLAPDDTLGSAARLVIDGFQHDFPVTLGGSVVGVLTHADLIGGLSRLGHAAPVSAVMQRSFAVADPAELLEPAVIARLNESSCRTLPVVQAGRLVGIVTPEQLSELLLVRTALRGSDGRKPVPV
jgi:Zn-dependent protease/predicted transcriptional regulator